MGCKCNRVMHSARFLFLLGLGFSFGGWGGTQQVNGSVGELDLQLELARSNSVSWLPGSLGSTWRVTIGRQKRPFENALDEANELGQVQVQQGVGTAAVGTVGVGTASVGTASVGNVFEQSK